MLTAVFAGHIELVRGEGMPIYQREGARGNLFVEISVRFPDQINAEQRDGFKRLLE